MMKLPFVSRREFDALAERVRALEFWAGMLQQQLAGGPPAPRAPEVGGVQVSPNLAGGPPAPRPGP